MLRTKIYLRTFTYLSVCFEFFSGFMKFHPKKRKKQLVSTIVSFKRYTRGSWKNEGGWGGKKWSERRGEIWQRIRQRFPEDRGGRKDDRLLASIETAIEEFASRSTRFFHWLSFTPASRLTPFCRRAFHPAKPSGPTRRPSPSSCFSPDSILLLHTLIFLFNLTFLYIFLLKWILLKFKAWFCSAKFEI